MAKRRILLRHQAMSYLVLALACILPVWSYGKDNDPNAKESEKAEQPNAVVSQAERFSARTFNSNIALRVWVKRTSWSEPMYIGTTLSNTPLEIPACWVWGVRPFGQVKNWDLLIREINRNKIPGLSLAFSTDSDLKHLVGLTGLQVLYLAYTKITDAGLEHLAGLAGLQELGLSYTQVTDAGLKRLQALTGLQVLYLSGTKTTDAGLAHLASMTGLVDLGLGGTQITDAGLEHLAGLTGLQGLNLDQHQGHGCGPGPSGGPDRIENVGFVQHPGHGCGSGIS